MNIKRTILSAALLACQLLTAQAQSTDSGSLTTVEKQKMMLKVVELFEDYERYSGIDEDFTKYVSSFQSLFISGDAPVFNDIIGITHEPSLSVKDYAKLMSEQSITTRVSISDIKNQPIYYEDGKWKMECSFSKNVNITNKCGIEYSSDFFNETDYRLDATILFDKESGQCKFTKITGSSSPKIQLEKDYRVVTKTSELDNDVLYNGMPLVFNSMGQAFISSMGKFTLPSDPERVVKEVIDDEKCRLMHLNLVLKSWRLKAHFDLGLGNAYEIEKKDKLSSSETKSNSFGLDFGHIFRSKSKFKIGVFTGFGVTTSNIDLAYVNSDYSYNTNADVDGDNYDRHYKNLSLAQKVKLSEFNIPLYFDLAYHFNPIFGLYSNIGLRFNINMSNKIETTEGSAEIYGVYKDYNNLVLDENWPYNGFGRHQYSSKDLLNTEIIDINKSSFDAIGSLGFRFNIPNIPVSVDLGVNYLMGLTEIVKTGTVIDSNSSTRLIYNETSGLNSVEKVRNLTEMLDNIKRKHLSASLGVILKF